MMFFPNSFSSVLLPSFLLPNPLVFHNNSHQDYFHFTVKRVSLISQMLVYTKEGDYLHNSTKNAQLHKVSVPHNVTLIYTNGPTDFIWVAQAFTVQTFQC